jgi:Sel1 repeat
MLALRYKVFRVGAQIGDISMTTACSTNRLNRALTSFALLSSLCICSCHSQQPKNPSLGQLLAKAQKGDLEAEYQLGLLYERGSPEAAKDSAKAIQWFRVLADKGDRRGENALGIAYLHGYGVTEDDTTGFEWFYKAAVNGYPAAQFNLAGSYYRGRGTPKNGKKPLIGLWRRQGTVNPQLKKRYVFSIRVVSSSMRTRLLRTHGV